MKSILPWFVTFISKTLGTLHYPYVDKKFNLKDYFLLEESLRNQITPFAIGCVKTQGFMSNLLINIGQKNGIKDTKTCVSTHVFAHIGVYKGYKHRVVEAVGSGIQEISLLEAIGQRDYVIIRVPNLNLISNEVCSSAIDFLKNLATRDEKHNIEYDNEHDLKSDNSYDCSETIYKALDYAFKANNQENKLKLVSRFGIKTITPIDFEKSDLFITIYDSRVGFIK